MIIRIAILGICVCLLSVILKEYAKEVVLPLQLSFIAVVIAVIFDNIRDISSDFLSFIGNSEIGLSIFYSLLKGAFICVVTKIACDVADDSGNRVVAGIIDIAGRLLLISLGFPYIESVIKTATSFLP